MISPLTAALDLNGLELILDVDADTSITADTDDRIDFKLQGQDLFVMNGATASAVNGLQFLASAAGSAVQIQAQGADTDVSINLVPKGAGTVQLGGSAIVTGGAANTFTSTDTGATIGPVLILDRNSASPAAADVLGGFQFKGRDSGAGTDTYALIQAEIVDQTATSEDGRLGFQTVVAGSLAQRMALTDRLTMSVAIERAKGADIASATTTDLSTVTGNLVDVTGTTTITGLGTAQAGTERLVRFTGALTLTHNGTSLIIPGAGNITTANGDRALFVSLGSGNWLLAQYQYAAGLMALQGKQTIWVPAGALTARTTNGAAGGSVETSSNKVMLKTLDFDAATIEYAQFNVRMPKSYNLGTVSAIFVWKHAATTTNFGVVWALQGQALSDDDAADTAFGTAVTVTDSGGTTNDVYMSAETSAITIGGTPALGDWHVFQAYRDATNGSDTMAIDAGLLGVLLFITTNAGNDA